MRWLYCDGAKSLFSLNLDKVPASSVNLSDAFTCSKQVFSGAAIVGVLRGGLLNEARPRYWPQNAARAAEVQHPAQQGLVSSFSLSI